MIMRLNEGDTVFIVKPKAEWIYLDDDGICVKARKDFKISYLDYIKIMKDAPFKIKTIYTYDNLVNFYNDKFTFTLPIECLFEKNEEYELE